MDRLKQWLNGDGNGGSQRLASEADVEQNTSEQNGVHGGAEQQPADNGGCCSYLDELATLSFKTRVQIFLFLFCLGLVVSVLGAVNIYVQNYRGFGLLVSLGSVLSLLSTMFLMGPCKQIKQMFQFNRLIATVLYILAILMTIVAGVVLKKGLLTLIMVVLQYVAMGWYCISYIPYAREAVSKICCSCC